MMELYSATTILHNINKSSRGLYLRPGFFGQLDRVSRLIECPARFDILLFFLGCRLKLQVTKDSNKPQVNGENCQLYKLKKFQKQLCITIAYSRRRTIKY